MNLVGQLNIYRREFEMRRTGSFPSSRKEKDS